MMGKDIAISAKSIIVPPPVECKERSAEVKFITTGFDTRGVLGKKGTRSMDKLTGLTIHCIENLMPCLSDQRQNEPDQIGIVVGSAQGSMDSIVRFTYESLAHGRPDYVNPALFPNTVMNCAAGQTAIWYGLKGPNATISSESMSSFAAFSYAISLLRNRYVDTLIAGGVEELTEVSIAANNAFANKLDVPATFTESSAFFVVETRSVASKYERKVLATINSISTGFNPDPDNASALFRLIMKVIDDAGIEKNNIDYISTAGLWPQTDMLEQRAIDMVFDGKRNRARFVDINSEYGNGVSSHNALQLNAVLEKIDHGQRALMFAQDLKGNMAAMVITGDYK